MIKKKEEVETRIENELNSSEIIEERRKSKVQQE